MENLAARMRERLPAELLDFLRVAGEEAGARGQRLYLVGGAVRDLLLGRHNLDFDLVVEGDAAKLAHQLARAAGEQLIIHRRFGTAKFQRGDTAIDVVTARSEAYDRPGALPSVRPGTIRDDLIRRDFSINAMAAELSPGSFGQLLDPHRGMSDIERGLVRVLHDKSFIDDATRMLRALRYEQRLGFKLEAGTQRLLSRDLSMLDTISGDRLKHELELILIEELPERILKRAGTLGVLKQIHPALGGDAWLTERFTQARKREIQDTTIYLLLLIYRFDAEDVERLIARLNYTGRLARAMRQMEKLKSELPAFSDAALSPSAVYRALERYHPETIAACALASRDQVASTNLERYLTEFRHVKTSLGGDDLKALGVEPGPKLGKMLRRLRDARLDGEARSRQDEENLTSRWMRKN